MLLFIQSFCMQALKKEFKKEKCCKLKSMCVAKCFREQRTVLGTVLCK